MRKGNRLGGAEPELLEGDRGSEMEGKADQLLGAMGTRPIAGAEVGAFPQVLGLRCRGATLHHAGLAVFMMATALVWLRRCAGKDDGFRLRGSFPLESEIGKVQGYEGV